MGVDFTAYTQFKKLEQTDEPTEDDDYHDWYIRIFNMKCFEERGVPFEQGASYTYTDSIAGPSLSYGGYNVRRNNLARLAGYPQHDEYANDSGRSHAESAWNAEGGILYELIHFADNEGTLGTAACVKIARELKQLEPKVDQMIDGHFKDTFKEMLAMFETACDGGAVVLN